MGNRTKGLSSLPVICTEDAGGRGWGREGEGSYGFKEAEDIPPSEVSCGMTEAIYRHTGFNPVAFTPAFRAIWGALDCPRPPPGAGGEGQERGDQALLEQLGSQVGSRAISGGIWLNGSKRIETWIFREDRSLGHAE